MAGPLTNFRSVRDSDWIDVDDIAGLIGTNESGKTNLLVPLWKLKPANGGEIDLIADYPRKSYHEAKSLSNDNLPVFIEASFAFTAEDRESLALATGIDVSKLDKVFVSRSYNGEYVVDFGDFSYETSIAKDDVLTALESAKDKAQSLPLIDSIDAVILESDDLDLSTLFERILSLDVQEIYSQTDIDLKQQTEAVKSINLLSDNDEATSKVLELLPSFVYYSHYGNLDSEIYLPHVIDNIHRLESLGVKEKEKARTLKVLFDFVNLDTAEILELGKDIQTHPHHQPDEYQIQAVTDKKKEREILLQSASTDLTEKFTHWWKQGSYKIRFQADGNHFRIWISDELRPEEIELESRSTGLQWFFSFYLVFLVESENQHKNSILLLDEPGLSLHPLAQKDLSAFFESLSNTNQIIYTTHSPFLVDSEHLDRIVAVYVDEGGYTVTSPNLRAGNKATREKSIYPVHAALGLTVSDILLDGCLPVIVEGPSDQHYLNIIKNFLLSKGKIKPKTEMIFLPAGGAKGIKAVAPIISGKSNELPNVLIDSDKPGNHLKSQLSSALYQSDKSKLIRIANFCNISDAEVEDLMPGEWLAGIAARLFKGPEDDFDEVYVEGKNIINQIEKWAADNDYQLPSGWKVDLAKAAKQKFLKKVPKEIDDTVTASWKTLFDVL